MERRLSENNEEIQDVKNGFVKHREAKEVEINRLKCLLIIKKENEEGDDHFE